MLTRRHALKGTLAAAGASALTGEVARAFAKPARARFRNGMCATQYSKEPFSKGIRFEAGRFKATNVVELERLMMAYGSNEFFSRTGSLRGQVANDPGFDGTLERAKIARSLNLPLNPEFLLCSSYGDVSRQPPPDFRDFPEVKLVKPWLELSVDQMCDVLRVYGKRVARELLDTGVHVNVWDIGNEVELGIAGVAVPPWGAGPDSTYKAPDAIDPEIGKMNIPRWLKMSDPERVAWGQEHLWSHVGKILAAVADGIREVDRSARFATHASGLAAQMPQTFVAFHESLARQGFMADQLGVSFYPTSNNWVAHRFDLFKDAATLAKKRLGRRVYVAEYGYAAGPMKYGPMDWANAVEGYPTTPEGQARFLRDLTEWGVRTDVLSGIRPWAPDFVGSGWQNMALFGEPVNGVVKPRPALSSIQDGLKLALAGR